MKDLPRFSGAAKQAEKHGSAVKLRANLARLHKRHMY
jgi:hypothetical protein